MSLNYSQNEKCFRKKVVEKIETHILCSVTFLSKIVLFINNVEKYCTAGQAT